MKPRETASLLRLVDEVFMKGHKGRMRFLYPQFFSPENIGNHFVCVDDGRVVSHVGMAQRWACLAGCTVRVALLGSVATLEPYRGQNLAGDLFAMSQAKAFADEVDIMMISGGRTLYSRAGAEYVGLDSIATIETKRLRNRARDIALVPFKKTGLPLWAAAYQSRAAHFMRPPDDWLNMARISMNDRLCFLGVMRNGAFRGYIIATKPDGNGEGNVREFAGNPDDIAAALKPLGQLLGHRSIELRLQSADIALKQLLQEMGATLKVSTTSGTLLLINFPQLMERLRPFFETKIGSEAAKQLAFKQSGDQCIFTFGHSRIRASRAEAARLIFGHPKEEAPAGIWRRIFPVPTLWYGINYV